MLNCARFTSDSDVFAWSASPQALPSTLINFNEQTFSLVRCSEPLDKTHTTGEDATVRCAQIEPQASTSSVVALVPALTPPVVVRLFDVRQSQRMRDLTFSSSVRAVRLNMKRLVVILEEQVQIFDAETLRKLHTMDAPRQSTADCCALSVTSVFAIGAARAGSVLVFDSLNLRVLHVIPAHQTPITCLALSDDGLYLATASETGTIIRVFSALTGEKIATFRRGARPRNVKCLCFSGTSLSSKQVSSSSSESSSPSSRRPQFLAVGSDNGTVHVFSLPPIGTSSMSNGLGGSSTESGSSTSTVAGGLSVAQSISTLSNYLVSNWFPTSVSDIVAPARCVTFARAQSSPLACCFASEASTGGGGGMVLRVVTEDGYFREFKIGLSTATELPLKRYKRIIGGGGSNNGEEDAIAQAGRPSSVQSHEGVDDDEEEEEDNATTQRSSPMMED